MESNKIQYSTMDNLKFILEKVNHIGKRYYLFFILYLLLLVIIPFGITLLPGYIISLFETKQNITNIIFVIVIILFVVMMLNALRQWLEKQVFWVSSAIIHGEMRYQFYEKLVGCVYELLQKKEVRNDISSCPFFLSANLNGSTQIYNIVVIRLLANIFGFLLYTLVVATLQIWILVILIGIALLNYKMQMKARSYEMERMGAFWANNDQHWYLRRECEDVRKGKDIRLYQMQKWFNKRYEKNTEEATHIYSDIYKKNSYANIGVRITSFVRDILVYGYLIYLLTQNELSIALFVVYVGVVNGFSTWLIEIVFNFSLIRQIDITFNKYRNFLELKDRTNQERKEHLAKQAHEIVFENVNFAYEKETQLLKDFNLKVAPKEKIALVGVNGAGKTTLMKLLCNLYPLDSGDIKIDGYSISDINRDEYFEDISIVFQEINEFALSLAGFVSCVNTSGESEETYSAEIEKVGTYLYSETSNLVYDEDKVVSVLKQAGLWEKVSSLPKGIYTNLTKHIDKKGIMLSGGEMQKLMLARALYKDANILILDEPTAALDPIAESEMYEKYASLCEDKTSIFISHRLSSTKFCDRILFLENGEIIEEGTHEQLMAKGGKYAKMFAIQSHYYQEEV